MKKTTLTLLVSTLLLACGAEEGTESDNNSTADNSQNEEITDEENSEEELLDIEILLEKVENVPVECEYKGQMNDAYTWTDKKGINYFIRTIGTVKEENDADFVYTSQNLYAYHYVQKNGNTTLVREVTDFVEDCEFDLIMGHELGAISLTDIDEDQIGEISFIYRLTCTSDVSPSTQKLIMLEDGEKYPLRGTTRVMDFGGEFEAGEEFNKAPNGFLDHATKMWNDNLKEYDFDL
ncbi:hypothetical protein K6119_05760 [Paracrocinitomix mangrovi]|uniref:M949_RS01915 family surface polysaccharide biosynthesis protein n=1 Tax=Paracrocinitomix mangrovi TaxID=2862509 RepID=UPI001C8E92E1|nr:hypothetical protein [Paracrocinitomix mangrovi]UKN03020.1 hypothetical protein K6119_05760 [Paracrocinitomix mangrovi]